MRQYNLSTIIYKALGALPFLMISARCYTLMDVPRLMELWQPALNSDSFQWDESGPNGDGAGSMRLLKTFYRIGLLDWYWRGLTLTFAPATLGVDPVGWWTALEFLLQLAPVYAVWMMEASRNDSGPKRL
jgi:hypothetical protein